MAITCEECKCTIERDTLACENGCKCCNREGISESLATREAQILAITEEEREEYSEDHPIMYAEQGPNRFALMSLFFPEEDGVRIEEDLSGGEIIVTYFNEEGERIITEGAVYEWAVNYYRENY
jgi:hypothetical protein